MARAAEGSDGVAVSTAPAWEAGRALEEAVVGKVVIRVERRAGASRQAEAENASDAGETPAYTGETPVPHSLSAPHGLQVPHSLPPSREVGGGEEREYWVRLPAGYGPGQRPAMVIALHGTDDTAGQMIAFWSGLKTPVPVLLVAPQGVGKGWREADLATIQAMWTDLEKRFGFDRERVLLAGFSAGGAMTFELLYKEKLPVTAAAALANYVPPRLTAEEVTARRDVPVFYAVGMADLNYERMRGGLDFLRQAGAAVEIHRPRIGHTLDPEVGQHALDWFFEQARKRLDAEVDEAATQADTARAVLRLEGIISQAPWHEPEVVQKAARTLRRREEPGRADLEAAGELERAGRQVDAAELLGQIETEYGRGRLGREARQWRERLEANPAVRAELARREARRRVDEAAALYTDAQRLAARGRHTDAAAQCHQIIIYYGETPAADRARRLLELLQTRRNP